VVQWLPFFSPPVWGDPPRTPCLWPPLISPVGTRRPSFPSFGLGLILGFAVWLLTFFFSFELSGLALHGSFTGLRWWDLWSYHFIFTLSLFGGPRGDKGPTWVLDLLPHPKPHFCHLGNFPGGGGFSVLHPLLPEGHTWPNGGKSLPPPTNLFGQFRQKLGLMGGVFFSTHVIMLRLPAWENSFFNDGRPSRGTPHTLWPCPLLSSGPFSSHFCLGLFPLVGFSVLLPTPKNPTFPHIDFASLPTHPKRSPCHLSGLFVAKLFLFSRPISLYTTCVISGVPRVLGVFGLSNTHVFPIIFSSIFFLCQRPPNFFYTGVFLEFPPYLDGPPPSPLFCLMTGPTLCRAKPIFR